MIENEKVLTALEMSILSVISENPNVRINLSALHGFYQFKNLDFLQAISRLEELGFLEQNSDFGAPAPQPIYYITQNGKEYLHTQAAIKKHFRQLKKSTKINWIQWLVPLLFGFTGAVLGSVIALFSPEIRAFFGL